MSDQLPVAIHQAEIVTASTHAVPALIAAAGAKAGLRFLEFFATNIRNPHTRRAYGRAVAEFLAWCDDTGVPSVTAVQPLHVAAWIELQTRERAAPSVKQQLAALRHLFDWLVTGQVVPGNPRRRCAGRSTSSSRARRRCWNRPRRVSCSTAST
jgi:site-specific recombinase XerC